MERPWVFWARPDESTYNYMLHVQCDVGYLPMWPEAYVLAASVLGLHGGIGIEHKTK